jgi:UDP-glucose 4-epimerase
VGYWKDKSVLVTGGAGFIGHRLVAALTYLGANVTVIDDLSKGKEQNLRPLLGQVRLIQADLLNSKAVKHALDRCQVCFHLAAKIGGIGYFHKTPATILRDNSLMNFSVWDAAVGTDAKMVCLSSSMVFERTTTFPTPESAIEASPPPKSSYGFSKLLSEYVARTYHEEFGVKYVIARPFNVYGAGEIPGEYIGYAHVIPDLIGKILGRQYPLEILGSGKQTRCYTYIDDVVDGILYVSEKAENDDFNIGANTETSVIELAERIWKLCKRKEPLKVKHMPSFKYDVQRRIPDSSKIKRLGWTSKTSLDEGLKKTIEWIRLEHSAHAFQKHRSRPRTNRSARAAQAKARPNKFMSIPRI